MTSRSGSSFAIVAVAAAIAAPLTFTPTLRAQDLALVHAMVGNTFTLHTEGPGVPTALGGLPADTDVTAGLEAGCTGQAGWASAYGHFEVVDQSMRFILSAGCGVGANLPGASGGAGRPSVIIVLTVPRPMTVRFLASAAAIVGPGTPPCRAIVDVGADGVPELDFVSQVGTCGSDFRTVELALPAGQLQIRLTVDVELPASAVGPGGQFASSRAEVLVEPAHATVTTEDAVCVISSGIHATPMLDGSNVRFYVHQNGWSTGGWLVLGLSRAQLQLPHTPWCSLLVTPDVVLPMSPNVGTLLPLGLLGPGELFAQSVVTQAPSPGQPTPLLLTSRRLRLQLR